MWFARVWNQGDESAIDELYAPTAVAYGLPATQAPGPDGFKPFVQALRTALPDIHIEVTHALSEGDLAAVHCRVTGTHMGDMMGAAPTKRPVEFTGMTMARVRDGQIVEGWNAYDFMTMYQQLGIEPPQPA
jgi:predicted ester cyclase